MIPLLMLIITERNYKMNCTEYEKIEEIIGNTFSAELRVNALDFILFLKNNLLELERILGYWKNQHYWAVKYNNEYVCFMLLNGTGDEKQFAPLTVWTDDSGSAWYENYPLTDSLKKIAWENVDCCVHCGSCSGGTEKVVFGRKFHNICKTVMKFTNPDSQTFVLIKELVRARICDIEG